jgi:hypothetical protein
MNATIAKHMAAIEAGEVTKSNVIGIKKAINAAERRAHGWSVGSTAPRATVGETLALRRRLMEREPRVLGELHESGAKILRSPRWRRRFNEAQLGVIERLDHFALAGFDRLGPRGEYAVPVYRAKATTGQSFLFRNVPWQTADVLKIQSGPVVVGEFR